MAAKDIEAGKAYVELLLKDGKFTKGLKAASAKLKRYGSNVTKIGAGITAMGSAIVGPIIGAVKHFASFGDTLDKMSLRTGVAAGALAEMKFAAEQSGAGIENVEDSIKEMQKKLVEAGNGSESAKKGFSDLGISLDAIRKMAPDEQFQLIADRVSEIEDPTKRAGAAFAVLADTGHALLPMMENMRNLRQQARDLNLVPSEESVKSAAEVTDAMNVVSKSIGATFYEIGAAVADTVLEALDYITGILTATTQWVRENKELFVSVLKIGAAILAAGAAVTSIGIAISGAGIALGGIATGLGVLGSILATVLSPLGIITAALVGGIYLWSQYTESGRSAVRGITGFLGELSKTVKDTFGGIFDAIAAGDLALAGKIAMTGLRIAFLQGVSAISKTFGGAFGDFLGTIGSMISGGDFAGAWETAVLGMSAIWDSFVEGIVAVFTNAARAILDLWEGTVNKISDQLLKMSAEGGIFGEVANVIVGADLQEIQRERDRLNKALGVNDNANVLEDSQASARKQTGSVRDSIQSHLDNADESLQRRSDESAKAFRERTKFGTSDTREEFDRLQTEYDELLAQAAQQRKEAAEKRRLATESEIPTGEELEEGSKQKLFGSFSAAAALVQGQGQSPVVKKLDSLDKKLEKLVTLDEEQTRISERTGDRILNAMTVGNS